MSLLLLESGSPFVLIHIPKCGGTSIRSDKVRSPAVLFNPLIGWEPYPRFAVIRDPLSRLVSAWKDFYYLRALTKMEWASFLRWIPDRLNHEEAIINPKTIEHHIAPMTHPVHGLQHATYVGRQEHLQESFYHFCHENRIKPYELGRERDSGGFPDPVVTSQEKAIIRAVYAKDYLYLKEHEDD